MRLITLLLLLTFSFNGLFGQNSQKKNKNDYYILISDTSFVASMPEQGATLKAEFKNDKITKITTWFGFNFGDVTREYYYWNDSLITVLETQKLYNGSAVPKIVPDSVKASYTGRYVFKKGKLTDISQKGSYSISDTPTTKEETEVIFLMLSKKYIDLVNEKRAKKKNRIRAES